MKVLVFDTETTGVNRDMKNPTAATNPYIVQLAGLLFDLDDNMEMFVPQGTPAATHFVTLLNYGVEIPAACTDVHGITKAMCDRAGVPPSEALYLFREMMDLADLLVAHNAEYDIDLLKIAYARDGWDGDPFKDRSIYDTMKVATPIVKARKKRMNGPEDWKWPTLTECYKHFFNMPFEGAHDAGVDCLAALDVYLALTGKTAILPEGKTFNAPKELPAP